MKVFKVVILISVVYTVIIFSGFNLIHKWRATRIQSSVSRTPTTPHPTVGTTKPAKLKTDKVGITAGKSDNVEGTTTGQAKAETNTDTQVNVVAHTKNSNTKEGTPHAEVDPSTGGYYAPHATKSVRVNTTTDKINTTTNTTNHSNTDTTKSNIGQTKNVAATSHKHTNHNSTQHSRIDSTLEASVVQQQGKMKNVTNRTTHQDSVHHNHPEKVVGDGGHHQHDEHHSVSKQTGSSKESGMNAHNQHPNPSYHAQRLVGADVPTHVHNDTDVEQTANKQPPTASRIISTIITNLPDLQSSTYISIHTCGDNSSTLYLSATPISSSPHPNIPHYLTTWKISYVKKTRSFTLQTIWGTYLSCDSPSQQQHMDPDSLLRWDRPVAKEYEGFGFQFRHKHHQHNTSTKGVHSNGFYLRTSHRTYFKIDGSTPQQVSVRANGASDGSLFCATRIRCLSGDCFQEWIATDPQLHQEGITVQPPNSNPTIAILTSPKDLTTRSPEKKLSQERSFESMAHLETSHPTLVFTHDPGAIQLANKYSHKFRVITQYAENAEFSLPTYPGLIHHGFMSLTPQPDLVAFLNSDLLLTSSFLNTISSVWAQLKSYNRSVRASDDTTRRKVGDGDDVQMLLVGMRTNVDVSPDFSLSGLKTNAEVDEKLYSLLDEPDNAKQFHTDAQDYFVISRGLWKRLDVPDFVIGGRAFDNWFVAKANSLPGVITVDCSNSLTCIHQNHGTQNKESHDTKQSRYNDQLANRHGGTTGGTTADAPFWTWMNPANKHSILVAERWPNMLLQGAAL